MGELSIGGARFLLGFCTGRFPDFEEARGWLIDLVLGRVASAYDLPGITSAPPDSGMNSSESSSRCFGRGGTSRM